MHERCIMIAERASVRGHNELQIDDYKVRDVGFSILDALVHSCIIFL